MLLRRVVVFGPGLLLFDEQLILDVSGRCGRTTMPDTTPARDEQSDDAPSDEDDVSRQAHHSIVWAASLVRTHPEPLSTHQRVMRARDVVARFSQRKEVARRVTNEAARFSTSRMP